MGVRAGAAIVSQQHQVVIFGCGPLGRAVADSLSARAFSFLLVDADSGEVADVQARGFEATELDFTDDDALRSVGIGSWARFVFCVFEEPSRNLFLTLSARALAPRLTIVSTSESLESRSKLIAAGASKTIDPYVITGRWIHDLIRRPMILETVQRTLLGEANLELAEITVTPSSVLAGQRFDDIDLSAYNLLLMGLVDRRHGAQFVFRTSEPDHRVGSGDVLVLIGPGEEIQRFRNEVDRPKA